MTSYSVIYDRFKHRVEEDPDFFSYLNTLPEISDYIVEQRCAALLQEAVAMFRLACPPKVDLDTVSEDGKGFASDLNNDEIHILSSLMFEQYLERGIAKLRLLIVNYTSTDLRVFDPSNARETFQAMYDDVHVHNEALIDMYKNSDRDKGGYIGIDFSEYENY